MNELVSTDNFLLDFLTLLLSTGGGKGSWSAWKAGAMARRYEDRGGDYEDTEGSKNKAQKGPPEKKE
jgi:hypothetical protein